MAKAEMIDLPAVKELLLWCRAEKIRVSQVSCGGIALAMDDLALSETLSKKRLPETSPLTETGTQQDIYRRWAPGLDGVAPPEPDNTVYEDDE